MKMMVSKALKIQAGPVHVTDKQMEEQEKIYSVKLRGNKNFV
jgi:hypothetical protein